MSEGQTSSFLQIIFEVQATFCTPSVRVKAGPVLFMGDTGYGPETAIPDTGYGDNAYPEPGPFFFIKIVKSVILDDSLKYKPGENCENWTI